MLALQPFFHGDNRVKLTESGFRADVGGLFAFGPLDDIKGDFLAFFQGLEALRLHRTEVSEQILATFVRGHHRHTLGSISIKQQGFLLEGIINLTLLYQT